MIQPRCDQCRFSCQIGGAIEIMICRRHAPKPMAERGDGDSTFDTIWPMVLDDDWCGEFQPKTP